MFIGGAGAASARQGASCLGHPCLAPAAPAKAPGSIPGSGLLFVVLHSRNRFASSNYGPKMNPLKDIVYPFDKLVALNPLYLCNHNFKHKFLKSRIDS